ncbi:FapA family protein [Candidatus Dependentiae bacterium]|nr:FapA family protein [Candidatus Dependentiae bacterium]
MKKIKVAGETLEKCLKQISEQIHKPVSEINDYKIIQTGEKGFLGFFKKPFEIEYVDGSAVSSADDFRINEALKVAQEFDGFFTIDYQDSSAYLTVYPPGGSGKSVDLKEIISRLELLKVHNIDEKNIKEALTDKIKTAVKVADWPDGESYNSYFKIETKIDKMAAYCTIFPPKKGGKHLSADDIMNGLKNNNIVKDIFIENIKTAINNCEYHKKFVAAAGREPVNGSDAFMKYFFNVNKEVDLKIKHDGSVDFRELNIIQTIKKDAVICEKINHSDGIDGYDVFGKVIKAKPGNDLIIKNGRNTYLDAEKQKVFAAKDGEPTLNDAGEVSVNEILSIEGDVNYSTGNINFLGSVIIEGRIEDNFTVKAAGDIIVKGNIGKSVVDAGSNIIVDGGIIGKNEAVIKSGKNVYAKFIESSNVFAKQDIVCRKMIMHSNISAGVSVRVSGDRGALMGGITRAGESVVVNELGAVGAAVTTVEVGIKPEIIMQLSELENKKIDMTKKLDKIKLGIQTLEKRNEERELDGTEKVQALQLNSMAKSVSEQIDSVKFEIIQIKRNSEINPRSKIQVYDKLFANVHVLFGNIQRNFSKEEIHVRLGVMDGKIVILPYD